MWHINSIRKLSKEGIANKFGEEFATNTFKLPNLGREIFGEFCSTCAKYITQGNVPRLAIVNGLVFPDIPEVLKQLTPMEERLVSPRHVFLKIVRKGQGLGFQHGLVGNVINVPVQINNIVSALPRSTNDDNVITVELRRKLCYRHGRKEQIRPEYVRRAAQYLVNCDLFKENAINLNESWDVEEVDDNIECTCDGGVAKEGEEEETVNPGGTETLLDDNQDVIVMAPGEGHVPKSLLFDENLEELAFIKVHCGIKRDFKIKLSHAEVIKSEISRCDRRAVRPDYLFTALKKQQMITIKNSISTCLRKKTVKGAPVLACNVLDASYIDNLVQHDDGYRVLRGVRNSPSHWEAEKKKVLGMIRQFGVPSFFVTLSAAEAQWTELLIILKQIIDGEKITESDAERLTYETKARLIQSDPFICASYFETKLREIRKTWSCPEGPFGKHRISHFYYRIEFQHRGSPHAHIMLWLEEAPIFVPGNSDTVQNVVKFVDEIVSCDSNEITDDLLRLQTHKHTHTCRPKLDRPCRFEIPFFPMDYTIVLVELPKDDACYKRVKDLAKNIQSILQSLPEEIETFEEFLNVCNITYDDYILAIRSTLKRPKVFLKRSPKDVYINSFSRKILELHQANMDIQYILDPFACAVYIVDYINKADKGMSRLLRDAVEEAKKGKSSIKESLRSISNVFLNASEISAQEAIYCISGLPLSRASEAEIYLNTSLPQERVHILKSMQEIRNMDEESSDIFQNSFIDYYAKRPVALEDISLAYFAAYFVYSKRRPRIPVTQPNNSPDSSQNQTDEIIGNWWPLQDNLGFIRRKARPRIIRFRRFSFLDDPDNFYREQLMLYISWRNEEEELTNPELNLKEKFIEMKEKIKLESEQFNKLGGPEQFETLLSTIRNIQLIEESEEEVIGRGVNENPFNDFEFETQVGDVVEDMIPGGNPGPQLCGDTCNYIALPPLLPEDEVLTLTRKLNSDQRDILFHVTDKIFNSFCPIYLFVSGGAGVGKSVLIRALFQTLTLRFNREPGSNPDDLKILLTAFTGKAAFGIGGQTVHSALGLPISQAGSILPELSPSVANTLATKLSKLRLIIIDEISMLGSRTFHQINRRLQQIFHTQVLFAGISVIVVGDLRQLPPVGDNWVFQPNSRNPLAEISGTPLWDLFLFTELNQIMRQKDDVAFATALNNLASGTMTSDDIELFRSRCFSHSTLPDGARGAVNLYASNREVDDHNSRVLSTMESEGALSLAIDSVSGEPNITMKEKALETVSRLSTQQTYGLPKSLILKVGAKYMLTINIDTADGLTNGSTGVLTAIDFAINKETGEKRPLRIWLNFDDAIIGKIKRNKAVSSLSRYKNRLNRKWTPLEPVTYTIKRYKSSHLQVRRSQYPLVPAEAITIHKSQGTTLERVVVHLKPTIPRCMLYVACSRATTAQGLFIVTESFKAPRPPTNKDAIVKEMAKLRKKPF